MNTKQLLLSSLLVSMPVTALAAGFTDDSATVIANGTTCKKTTIQFTPPDGQDGSGKLVVSGGKRACKNVGFAKKLGELSDVTWNDRDRTVNFTVEDGSSYSITIKQKRNYQAIRQALIDAV